MALIGRIRKNFWFVLVLIFFALASFVIMDMVGQNSSTGGGLNNIGQINGTEVDVREFNAAEQSLFGGSTDIYRNKELAWDYMVEKAIITDESDEIGLNVPTEELKNLLFGASPSPIVRSMFTNQATQQFDRQSLLQVKQNIESGEALNPSFTQSWQQVEKSVRKSKLEDKMGALVAKGMYAPSWMVEQNNVSNAANVDISYVKIPFDYIEDEVTVTDDEVVAFAQKNGDKYNQDIETRMLEAFYIDVLPTPADSALWKEEVAKMVPEFRVAPDDSVYATFHNGFFSHYYNSVDQLPEMVKEVIPNMEPGEVHGPYLDNTAYIAMKLIDKRIVPDSVEARHILRSTRTGSTVAAARAYIDSLKVLYETGQVSFDSLAIKNSEDPGSSFLGGDLGTFEQGKMMKPFNDALFLGGKKGNLYTVTTEAGVHLIELQDVIYGDRNEKYKLAFVRTAITPSDDTQERLETEISDLVSEHGDIASLKEAISGREDIKTQVIGPFNANDYNIPSFGTSQESRDIIKWGFEEDTEVGALSASIYTYSDPINYFDSRYVLVGLNEVIPKGMPGAAGLRNLVESELLTQKRGEMIASQVSGSDLSAIAAQFGSQVDSLNSINFSTSSMPGIGNEPKLFAKAISMNQGQTSAPIVGSNGVYIVKVNSKDPGSPSTNVSLGRSLLNNTARSSAPLRLMDALREKADIADGRSKFF